MTMNNTSKTRYWPWPNNILIASRQPNPKKLSVWHWGPIVKYSSTHLFQSQSTPLWRISRGITCLMENGMKTLFTRGGISSVQARRMINKHFSKTPKTKFRLVRISSHMGIAHGLTVQIRYISSRHFYLCLKLPQELFTFPCAIPGRTLFVSFVPSPHEKLLPQSHIHNKLFKKHPNAHTAPL